MGESSSFVAGRGDAQQPSHLRASLLSCEHIGSLIRFRDEDDGRETVSIVTGELRQLSITASLVTVLIGVGAEEEYSLDPLSFVILRPAEHYGDVEVFLGRDPDYAQLGKR
ncbi:hypothetical protein Jolie1_057 [Mycobacterium phage Julie1]|uniref:Uncharacterized protein n=1 Tax=Mycobacterium phage Julie1 TaxID=1463812 RepID=W8EB71_9CAUD|nr:hypothetical protein CG90_gp57 [Mycobacterium phage Julie1]YP_009032281.1 hypothetical protein FH38_gp55 [Mycobacterium phage Hosp]AHJ88557.1 hypothetical protein Jolie1_057 [Mycobacterium phage Julie1]AHK12009.1 hypothetical protein Hosp_055 [Mycobacterium phage Hosp]